MNLKRVLVLVMALVMVVSACAPAILAVQNTDTECENHEHPELLEKYQEIKAIVCDIVKDVTENYETYYNESYDKLAQYGDIEAAASEINAALEELNGTVFQSLEMAPELKAELEAEYEGIVEGLEELRDNLVNGEANGLDGFVSSTTALVGDLNRRANSIKDILEQANLDYEKNVLRPKFYTALDKTEAAIEKFVGYVLEYAAANHTDAYNKACELADISRDAYDSLVEAVMLVELYADGTVEELTDIHNALINAVAVIYGMAYEPLKNEIEAFDYSAENLNAILNTAINTAIELDKYVEIGLEHLDKVLVWAIDSYPHILEVLVEFAGNGPSALTVATKIYGYTIDVDAIVSMVTENGIALATEIYNDIMAILNDSYENNGSLEEVTSSLSTYVLGRLKELETLVMDIHNGAIKGDYELTDDAYYVALGNAGYVEALAKMLNLSKEQLETAGLDGDYFEAIAKADLITIKLDNGTFVALTEEQLMKKAAEIIRTHEELMIWYNGLDTMINNESLPEKFRNGVSSAKATVDGIIDINGNAIDLDWNEYLDAEGQAALENLLAGIKSTLISAGVPEIYDFEINTIIEKVLEENGLGEVFNLTLAPIALPVADLVTFAIENMLYGYAEMVDDITDVINNSDALVVLTKINNPLVGYSFKGIDLSDYAKYLDPVVAILNANLYGIALANENVIFVNSEDANDIYEALNIICDHVYDNCEDTTCNRCLAVRVAPGHTFINYEFKESTSCKKDGTETAKCENCDATDTRTVKDTKGPHDWKDATCLDSQKCKVCGAKQGEPRGHVLGDWKTIKDPTTFKKGVSERRCLHCEYAEQKPISNTALVVVAIIAIVIVVGAVGGSVSAIIANKKRNSKNKAEAVNETNE